VGAGEIGAGLQEGGPGQLEEGPLLLERGAPLAHPVVARLGQQLQVRPRPSGKRVSGEAQLRGEVGDERGVADVGLVAA